MGSARVGVAARRTAGAQRRPLLWVIETGLVRLMDGLAFATYDPWNAFMVSFATSLGGGISMDFAEGRPMMASPPGGVRRCCAAFRLDLLVDLLADLRALISPARRLSGASAGKFERYDLRSPDAARRSVNRQHANADRRRWRPLTGRRRR